MVLCSGLVRTAGEAALLMVPAFCTGTSRRSKSASTISRSGRRARNGGLHSVAAGRFRSRRQRPPMVTGARRRVMPVTAGCNASVGSYAASLVRGEKRNTV